MGPLFTRRRGLKLALGAAGAAVAAGSGLLALRGSAPAVAGLRCLDAHAYRTLSKLAAAILPAGGAFAPGAEGMDLARAFDGYLADEPEWIQADLRQALLLLEYGPVLFERRLSTFSGLTEADRLAHFEAWMRSDSDLRRQIAAAFRRFLHLVFYDRPEVWPGIGYEGPR